MKHPETMSAVQHESNIASQVADAPRSGYWSSVVDQVYNMMSCRPNAVAVTDGDLEWTYDDLRRNSEAVARNLDRHGITHGSVVGMHLPRCADAIAIILGIMAAGCVYLPLDPSYPPARVRHMLDQASAVAVISHSTDSALYGLQRIWLPPPSQLNISSSVMPEERTEHSSKERKLEPQDGAYILFTSGSTGKPKGVLVTHDSITRMNTWSARVLGITSSDASATTCSLSFDPSFHEILLPLSAGGTVHVIPHVLALGQLTRPVSLVATTPTVASELLRAGHLPRLKVLMLGGEALAPSAASRLLASGHIGLLLNCYGPTECTVCVTVAEVTSPVPDVIPIGTQVPGTEILILDTAGRRLPDGQTGEICVFGGQVAVGYINDPAETAERFAVGPSGAAHPQRYYRTGDLGYRTGDGVIYFARRADGQVKVNGHRIELGEVDAVLRSHPEISDVATIVWPGDRLVAYAVPRDPGATADVAALRTYLSERLPRYMLPVGIVPMAELPRTVNGKMDAAALPQWTPGRPEHEAPRLGAADHVDRLTALVIEIVANVTGFAGQIRSSDDFIGDLGGTSLGIVQVLAEFERHSGRRMRVSAALADTSIGGLARLLREDAELAPTDFAFNTGAAKPPVFLVNPYFGGMLGLRRVAERLPSDQPAYGLQVSPEAERGDAEFTISALAQSAVKRIREIQPTGQITMIGQSAGGLVVFEAARSIAQSGGPEPHVLLMDTARLHGPFSYYWGEWVLYPRSVVPGIARKTWKTLATLGRAAAGGPGRGPAVSPADDLMAVNDRHLQAIASALKRYKGQAYSGSISVMRTRQGRVMARGRPSLGWAAVIRGRLTVIEVPGSHLTMVDDPHLVTVMVEVADWLSGNHRVTAPGPAAR